MTSLDEPKVIVLDCETNGFGDDAEIVQIGIMDLDGSVLIDSLVQCQGVIPIEAEQVHGITKKMLADAPTWPDLFSNVSELLSRSAYVVIYNDSFDVRLIKQTSSRYNLVVPEYKTRCAMREFGKLYFDGEYIKLSEAAKCEGIDTRSVKLHSAIGDCELTRLIWKSILVEKEKRSHRQAKSEAIKKLKMLLVPADVDCGQYPDFGQSVRPRGYKTLSQLRKRDLDKYEFAGTCCSSFGDKGYLFKPKLDQ